MICQRCLRERYLNKKCNGECITSIFYIIQSLLILVNTRRYQHYSDAKFQCYVYYGIDKWLTLCFRSNVWFKWHSYWMQRSIFSVYLLFKPFGHCSYIICNEYIVNPLVFWKYGYRISIIRIDHYVFVLNYRFLRQSWNLKQNKNYSEFLMYINAWITHGGSDILQNV